MKIVLHGGDCCGIKHIHGLSYYPSEQVCARKARKRTSYLGNTYNNALNDMRSHNSNRNYDFFNEAAPKESYEKRFERLVKFVKDKRKHGIIEVVLSNSTQKAWIPIVLREGFKEVSRGTNSNTSVVIVIYHLVY